MFDSCNNLSKVIVCYFYVLPLDGKPQGQPLSHMLQIMFFFTFTGGLFRFSCDATVTRTQESWEKDT